MAVGAPVEAIGMGQLTQPGSFVASPAPPRTGWARLWWCECGQVVQPRQCGRAGLVGGLDAGQAFTDLWS
ncbi:MAG TPA: hypothetical protein VFR23_11775 [Jiangellaceae bacterium]|nr:hypothetical protein [Jiangellaceae bacterium]